MPPKATEPSRKSTRNVAEEGPKCVQNFPYLEQSQSQRESHRERIEKDVRTHDVVLIVLFRPDINVRLAAMLSEAKHREDSNTMACV
jgi:hypothetical protein